MKKSGLTVVLAIGGLVATLVACNRDKNELTQTLSLDLPDQPYQYSNTTPEMGTLGRVLFYDKNLSLGNSVSCGSCHHQDRAFADAERFSTGFNGQKTTRNTPTIQNLTFGSTLFWDGREHDIVKMVTQPILNHQEMGIFDSKQMVERVKAQPYYAKLFGDAFEEESINFEKISTALGSFIMSIQSNATKFDFARFGINSLSPLEEQGRQLFDGKYNCKSCHVPSDPRGYGGGSGDPFPEPEPLEPIMVNIGLDEVAVDKGFGKVTQSPNNDGQFRIPNLRNVALTAPYMHDGRFNTLDEVLEHYSRGVKETANLDSRLKDAEGKPLILNISESDKKALIAFLNTMTDGDMINDPALSNPFKRK